MNSIENEFYSDASHSTAIENEMLKDQIADLENCVALLQDQLKYLLDSYSPRLENMRTTESGLPDIITQHSESYPVRSVNSVLVYGKGKFICGSNWQVVNTIWANKNHPSFTHWCYLTE